MKSKALLVVSILTAGILSCSPSVNKDAPGIVNRGIIPLSPQDAYLGSNIFLGHEMEKSTYLYNFMKSKGAPSAIELKQSFGGTAILVLFYPGSKEVYSAELVKQEVPGRKEPMREWIIRGPYQIERKDYKELSAYESQMKGEPVFKIFGKEVRFLVNQAPKTQTGKQVLLPVVPTPPPTPTPKPKKKVDAAPKETPDPLLDPKNFKALNTDQQALMMAKGYVERADNGDAIHTAKEDGETLAAIAKWYTGSDKNLEEVATMNGLTTVHVLIKGQRVRIPFKLLKATKVMP